MYGKDITFCILSYNRPLHLERCIESCLSHGIGSKIIVLDNSQDQTSIKVLQEQYPASIDWYFSEQTLGYAKNFHRSFSVCKSRFLVALHDDDRIMKDFCVDQLAILKKHKEASAISCNGFFINDQNEKTKLVIPWDENDEAVRIFETNDQYVEHKYSTLGGCIPFSPMLFDLNKAHFIKDIILQRGEQFGQVIDSILISDLLKHSQIILNYNPLYECGEHNQQDSKSYDNFWETQYMLFLLRGESISKRVKKKIKIFYMTDVIIDALKSFPNLYLLRKIVICREIISIILLPNVLQIIIARGLFKLKLIKNLHES
jgi:glycosyltransferase involved in cell wall biosynthesis